MRAFTIGTKAAEEAAGGGADCHSQKHGHWIVDTPIANPSSVFQDAKTSRKTWGIDALGTVVVEVELHSGVVGVGVSIGGPPACFMIEEHFSRFVEGQDVRNVELIWDQMWRGCVNYGRKGLPLQAMSAVDLAIWDALGIAKGEPVYNLLGGKTKEKCVGAPRARAQLAAPAAAPPPPPPPPRRLPMYATSTRPDLSKKMGFKGGKVPLPYGPADGDEGMRKNIEHLQRVRASVGIDFPLMVDCYMALTVPYTVELARRIDREVPGGVKWIEEFLPPDQYEGYAEVRQKVTTTLLTTGEHEYTRWGYRLLLEKKACDVLQPDITWVGGLTEARRVVALAAAYDIPVIPHGSSVYSYHMQFAFHNCPVGELIVLAPEADCVWPLFGNLFTDEPLPVDGYITLSDKPGFGVTLNRAGIAMVRPYPRTREWVFLGGAGGAPPAFFPPLPARARRKRTLTPPTSHSHAPAPRSQDL